MIETETENTTAIEKEIDNATAIEIGTDHGTTDHEIEIEIEIGSTTVATIGEVVSIIILDEDRQCPADLAHVLEIVILIPISMIAKDTRMEGIEK